MEPPSLALVRVAALAPVVAFLQESGVAVHSLLGHLDLPACALQFPESLIPLRKAVGFLEESARALGIDSLGVLAARETSITALGVFGRLVQRQETLADAIETALDAMPAFCSGIRCRLTLCGSRAELIPEFVDAYAARSRQTLDYWAGLMCSLVGLAQEHEGDRTYVARSNGVPAVVFRESLLARPLAPPSAACVLHERELRAWQDSAPAGDFPGSVQQVIRTLSSPAVPRIGLTAAAIGISVRGLQRRLAESGASYERLVFRARFETAMDLLAGTDVTVLAVALDAGYSDHAHFTRAFRRWTGMSPREFRRSRRNATPAMSH